MHQLFIDYMSTKHVSFTRQNGAIILCSKSQMHIRQEIDQPQQEVATPIPTVHASATTVKILIFPFDSIR